jgi:site-specific recombinase XerD
LIGLSNRSKNKLLIQLHGMFGRAQMVWGLQANPLARVEKHPMRASGDIQVFAPEEVWALVCAAGSEQDAAIYLTAAFTGLRMGELLALRWRDVDFTGATIRVRASYAAGHMTTLKSGKVGAVPMAPDVASALAERGRRENWVGDDDLVFAGELGRYLDGSALRRRYKDALSRAGLCPLRFHDLRHKFGTRMIAKADIRRVQEWTGHADIQTTMRYLHYAPHAEDAALVAEAFRVEGLDDRTSQDKFGHLGTTSLTSRDIASFSRRSWRLGASSGAPTPVAGSPGLGRPAVPRAAAAGHLGRILASAREWAECMPAAGVAMRCEGRHDVGARQRPNTGAIQRGRASVSSSAGNGGVSSRLGTCVRRLRRCLTPRTVRATKR